MKKIVQSITVLAIICIASLTSHAQNTWDWEAYGISMDLPSDFKLITNTDNEFEAEGDGMDLYMYIFEEDITLNEMKDATIAVANELELEEWDVVQNITTGGFEGKYIAGYLEGSAVLLSGLINPDNETNFFVVITFDDDDDVAEEDAMKILDSIR